MHPPRRARRSAVVRALLVAVVGLAGVGTIGLAMVYNTLAGGNRSFSAMQSDRSVLRALGQKQEGYFVDVHSGRSQGDSSTWFSNTLLLERWYGWRGVCLTVSENSENTNQQGFPGWGWGWLGLSHTCTQEHMALEGNPARTLTQILQAARAPTEIDYLSMHLKEANRLLKDFPHDEFRFTVIHVEIGDADEAQRQHLRDSLMDNGYLVAMPPQGHAWFVHSGSCRLTQHLPEGYVVVQDTPSSMGQGSWTVDCTNGSQLSLSQE